MIFLVLLYAILFFAVAWKKQLLALQLTLFALPAYLLRFKLGVPMTVLELMIIINFSVWFVKNIRFIQVGVKNRLTKERGVVEYPFGIEMILVVLAGLFGVVVAGFSSESLGVWKAYFFEPVLLLIVFYQVVGRLDISFEAKFKKLAWPLLWSSVVVSVFAIYQKITGNFIDNPLWQASETRRVVSVFGYPNAVGLFLETIVIYCAGLFAIIGRHGGRFEKSKRALALLALILAVLSIAAAKSNGAALGIVAGITIWALLYSGRTRLVWAGTVVIIAVLIFGVGIKREKAMEFLALKDFSGQVRVIGWSESWQMIKDGRIITGAGLSNFQASVEPYHVPGFYFNRDRDPDFQRKLLIYNDKYRAKFWQPLEIYMYPHNIALNFWSEIGLFGLLVFFWLVGRFYYLAMKYFRSVRGDSRLLVITAMSAMTAMLVHGLVDVPFFKNDLAVLFWLPVAIVGLLQLDADVSRLKKAEKLHRLAK